MQEPVGHLVSAGVPTGSDVVEFAGVEQFDITDRGGRLGDGRTEQAQELRGELAHRRRVEQVGGVGEFGAVAVGRIGDGELQVELRELGAEVHRLGGETGQFQGQRGEVLHEQRDLEQRVPRLGASRVQHLDQTLERDVAVGEGAQVTVAGMRDQVGEGRGSGHLGAQDQGVDEHADQIVEFGGATAGDRRADGDVGGPGQPRQQRGECGVQHHERGRTGLGGQAFDGGAQLAIDAELVHGAAIGGLLRAWAIGRKIQLRGQVGEFGGPEFELAGGHGLRVCFVAEHVLLPQRVVGILHREGFPARRVTVAAGRVGGDQIAQQRAHGDAVGGDMVHHQHQGVVVGGRT
ncbi:hypothetical protein FMUBM48_49450 [Nocardia cyriacigeorgica]|nr:hypothetical protein FMUBM48_49450 [Nocardia cyriacigeorgica]